MLSIMAAGAVLLGFSSASQDIVIDAYRIESAPADMQPALSATYVMGYRIGMIVSGAGALYLADFWFNDGGLLLSGMAKTYLIMAAVMGIGILTTLVISEPKQWLSPSPKPQKRPETCCCLYIVCIGIHLGISWHG